MKQWQEGAVSTARATAQRTRLTRFVPATVRRGWYRRFLARRKFACDNLRRHDVADDIVVETYWLTAGAGAAGPSCSVWVCGDEVWRVDLLDGFAHAHTNCPDQFARRGPNQQRLLFANGDLDTVIDDALGFLRRNFWLALAQNSRRSIRDRRIGPELVDVIVDLVAADFESLIVIHHRGGATAGGGGPGRLATS